MIDQSYLIEIFIYIAYYGVLGFWGFGVLGDGGGHPARGQFRILNWNPSIQTLWSARSGRGSYTPSGNRSQTLFCCRRRARARSAGLLVATKGASADSEIKMCSTAVSPTRDGRITGALCRRQPGASGSRACSSGEPPRPGPGSGAGGRAARRTCGAYPCRN